MNKSKGAIARAKIVYFFKETFRAHSRAEYREIFSRGLNEDNGGVTGAFPWLYVRAFLALLVLFTINILVLRLTNNMLYVPSVTFLGGVTFTVPFIILLYELYPKRDISLFVLLAVLVVGGTASGVLCQLAYSFIKVGNGWVGAVVTGLIEEICKAIPAMIAIIMFRQKNPYACYLIAASVGAGFSVIEDMGYIFYYSDKFVRFYSNDIQNIIILFADRGLSSLCTHALWTGVVGWAFCIFKRPYRSFSLFVLASSVIIHICWDFPLEGWLQVVDITACVVVAVAINIAIVHVARMKTLAQEVDLTQVNERIISEAKRMGERMRYTNAAAFTFTLTCGFLSVIILLLCALPIGIEYTTREFESKEEFIAYIQDGYDITVDRSRKYDPDGENAELRYIEGELAYVVQKDDIPGIDGEYYYGYYLDGNSGEIDSVYAGLEAGGLYSRYFSREYTFGDETVWLFEINTAGLRDYRYNDDGTITAVVDADEFEGYAYLIGLCAAGVAIVASCTVILVAFRIKLRGKLKNEGQ